jgi:hypothetical protein
MAVVMGEYRSARSSSNPFGKPMFCTTETASGRPNDSGRHEFEQGRHTIGNRGRSRAGTGKKTEVTEERADEPGGLLLIAVDVRRMSDAMTKCEKGGGADVGRDVRPMWRAMVTDRESGMERGGA